MATQTEIQRRKRAVALYYSEHQTKAAICHKLDCTFPWLDRWLARYDPDDVEGSLRDRKRGPHQPSTPWSPEIRKEVIAMRETRSDRERFPYAFIGAEAIRAELEALQREEIPPERTIHRWIAEQGLVNPPPPPQEPRQRKPIPLPSPDMVNTVQQLDLKGPLYLQGSAHKYYLAVLRDLCSRRCTIQALESRAAQGITDFLVASWQYIGLPQYLQMDNALEFRGSNKYPRSFGRIIRIALDLEIEPVFNPAGEPWRNGGVEWFNGFLDERFTSRFFRDFPDLDQQAHECQEICNATHRYSVLAGRTPDEVCAAVSVRRLPSDYDRHRAKKLPQNRGFVSFIRLIRKSGRLTLGAGDRFMVNPDLKHTYVCARVDVAQATVTITQDDLILRIYDFSPDTVGKWAGEEEPETDPDAVKELATNAIDGSSEH
jgi:putative transposase